MQGLGPDGGARQLRLAKAMAALAGDPLPRGSRKLAGYDDVYRIRAGRYRILYSLSRKRLVIILLKIGHRLLAYIGQHVLGLPRSYQPRSQIAERAQPLHLLGGELRRSLPR